MSDQDILPKIKDDKCEIVLCGTSGSGKTYLFRQLYQYALANQIDEAVLFCPSYSPDQEKPHVYHDIAWTQCYQTFSPELVSKVYDAIPDNHEEVFLLVFDDCVSEENFKKNSNDHILTKIAHRGRHKKIITAYLTQDYICMPSQIRRELDYLFLFTASKAALDAVNKEFGPMNPAKAKNFHAAIEEALSSTGEDDHPFVMYNKRNRTWYDQNQKKIAAISP